MIVMSGLCHDDSGFYVTHRTADVHDGNLCRLRARTSGLPRVATSEQSV